MRTDETDARAYRAAVQPEGAAAGQGSTLAERSLVAAWVPKQLLGVIVARFCRVTSYGVPIIQHGFASLLDRVHLESTYVYLVCDLMSDFASWSSRASCKFFVIRLSVEPPKQPS